MAGLALSTFVEPLTFGVADSEILAGVLSFLLLGPFLFFVGFALWRGLHRGDNEP